MRPGKIGIPEEHRSRLMKKKTEMTVLDSRMLAQDIWSLELAYAPEDVPEEVRPGQFAGLYPPGGDLLLMRPISICRWDRERGVLRFVYRAAGKGTRSFTSLRPGDHMDMLGILGNGYDLDQLRGKRVLLLGGGIGVPPMLELAAALSEGSAQTAGEQTSQKGGGDHSAAQEAGEAPAGVTAVMGYRNHELFLLEEMKKYAAVFAATEDGSAGTKGNVLDAVRENGIEADVICACGPLPKLRAISRFAAEKGIPAFLSLEERMACGVGVCLGCVTKTKKIDSHSKVNNARVCVEGPVFSADEVDL
jgi:dihydroorotate dehydrogenase electron transfer subunit